MADANVVHLLLLNTLGLSILTETLYSAQFIYTQSGRRSDILEHQACYAFIQGSGLDMLLEQYGLEYDPDGIRNGFNYYLRRASV